MSDSAKHVRNHWWWRPGWREGRHFYACHLTLDDQPKLHALVAQYQAATRSLPMLDQIPADWLHVTMQGIGFVDEIGPDDLEAIRKSLVNHLRAAEPPMVEFQHATIRPEAVYMKAIPSSALYRAREQMHRAIREVLGSDRFPENMPQLSEFTPHVSVAYANADAPAKPIADALAKLNPAPVKTTFSHASLLEFHRDNRMYEWTSAELIRFGPSEEL